MKFEYYLRNDASWAEILFEHNDIKLDYSVEDCLGENITDLLSCILVLAGRKDLMKLNDYRDKYGNHFDQHFDDHMFNWNIFEGPLGVKFEFKLSRNKKTTKLRIIEFDDFLKDQDDKNGKCVFYGTIDFNELINNILKSCSSILNKYGIIGYSKNFWREFPIVYFLLLKDYKEGKLVFDSFKEKLTIISKI